MLNGLMVAIIVASAIWVYLDATKNKIGKIPGENGMFNMSAGAWAVVTLLLWIIGFPAYLVKRASLIKRAKESPVDVSRRSVKTAALSVVGGLSILAVFSGAVLSALPACDNSGTKTLVGRIVNDIPIAKSAGVQFVALKDIVEQGYNEQNEIRVCRATLVTTAGEDALQYHVKWSNKDKGEYFIEAQIQ